MMPDERQKFELHDEVYNAKLGTTGRIVDTVGKYHYAVDTGDKLEVWPSDDIERVPPAHPLGLTSADLAVEVADSITRATSRILAEGQDRYDDGTQQQFEIRSPEELLEESLTALSDAIAYAVMAQIRVRQVLGQVDDQ